METVSQKVGKDWEVILGLPKISQEVFQKFQNLALQIENDLLQEELREVSLCCEAVSNTLPHVVTIHDPEMRIIKANRAAQEFLGLKMEDLIGKKCFELFHGTKEPPPDCPARRLFQGEGQSFQEMKLDLLGRVVRVDVSLLRDENQKIKGFVHIVTDLTEKRELEEKLVLAQNLEALGTLAGGIAHDFNNLLTPILGFAEVALLKSENQSLKGYLKNIISCAKRAKELVAQIQTFSHRGNLDREPLLLESMVKEAAKLVGAILPKNIEIKIKISPCGYVLGNPTEIQQILLNLASNAFHAMKERGGVLEILLEPTVVEGKPFARLSVKDTGEGIPPEIMPRIFDPYFTTKPAKEGTGLGLAVVQGIVKNSGGFIKVKSSLGQGTTFEIFLPLIEPPLEPKNTGSSSGGLSGKGEKILLLEDDEQNLKALTEALSLLGYKPIPCSSYEEALHAFFKEPHSYNLVITDLLLPGGRSDRIAEIFKEARPDLPVILLTGLKDGIKPKDSLDKVLFKPVSLDELSKALKEFLGARNDHLS